jgi:biopolymer transport protein ExbD
MDIRRKNKISTEGGMSSMTDLVFLMLIFFIIMSTMSNQTLPVNLPSTKSDPKPSKINPPIEIGVTEDDQYFFSADTKKYYTFDQIESVLEGKMADQKEKNIKISGDKNSSYESVLRIIALAKEKEWNPVLAYKME